jgi:Arc/MetJ-type ribon-helix-helix transcriptional regulator
MSLQNLRTWECLLLSSVTIGFSIPEEDQSRLQRLVEKFGQGNRSAFLRVAMRQMEVLDRAERLRELQQFGTQNSAEYGLDDAPVDAMVHRVLARHSAE